MIYYLIVGVIVVFFLAAAGWNLGRGRSEARSPVGGGSVGVRQVSSRLMSRGEIERELERLADRPVKKNLAIGAMCYKPAPVPPSYEYVCPVCGEKSLYAFDREDPNGLETSSRILWQLRDLEDCRRLAGQIEGLSIRLDERSFCRQCSPEAKEVELKIVVEYPEEGLTHRFGPVRRDDLEIIRAFLEGKTVFKTSHDAEVPLKNYLPRLRELLTVTPEERARRFLTREEIRQKLAEAARRPLPGTLKMGAMCYDMASPPNRQDYWCPTCGERTLYVSESQNAFEKRPVSWSVLGTLQRDLEECRRLCLRITAVPIRLDESQFCKRCSPEVKEPVLELVIEYPAEEREHRTVNPTAEDLAMLRAFFDGKASYKNNQDGEIPLSLCMKRLETLLGVTLQDDGR